MGESLLKCEGHRRSLSCQKMKAGDMKWDVNKANKITRYKMASSRRVRNDSIFEPRLPAPPSSALFWDMPAGADVLFGVDQP